MGILSGLTASVSSIEGDTIIVGLVGTPRWTSCSPS